MSAIVPRLLGAWSSYRSGESFSIMLGKLQLAWLALVDLIAIREQEKFTLFSQCNSLSKLRGTLALRFWEPNTSSPTKCGSRVQNWSAPCSFAIAMLRTLESSVRLVEHWATRSNSSSLPRPVLALSFLRYWQYLTTYMNAQTKSSLVAIYR